MNFNQFKYIVAVEKYRNFARAAEHCRVAQSTLSKEIQRLEKQFDVMIFDRTRHPVVPTLKGKDLVTQARNILREQEKFEDIAQQKHNEPQGEFKLGVLSVMAPYLLPLFARQLSAHFPQLELKITELNMARLLEQISSGELDGAISLAPFSKEGFYVTPVFEEEFVLYLNQDLSPIPSEDIEWENLPQEELILQEDLVPFFCGKNRLPQLDCNMDESQRLNFSGSSLETIRKMIDREGGITLIPKLACLYMGERRLKMVQPLNNKWFHKEVIFVTSRGFEKNRIKKEILKTIRKNIPSPPIPIK